MPWKLCYKRSSLPTCLQSRKVPAMLEFWKTGNLPLFGTTLRPGRSSQFYFTALRHHHSRRSDHECDNSTLILTGGVYLLSDLKAQHQCSLQENKFLTRLQLFL